MAGQDWMLVAIGAGVLLLVGIPIVLYNRLVSLGKRADGAWSDIDVQLKKRWDLVPALVSTVQGYARHERETLEQTVQARAAASHGGTIDERARNEQSLTQAVGRLFALAESYPDLKANQNFLDLQRSLVAIEDSVQSARRYFNAVVRDFNTQVASFPTLLVAGPMGFRERPFFELDDPSQRAAPSVGLPG